MNETLTETLARLYRLRPSEIKFGLETEEAILSRLQNPERHWRSIHVAGTNGKGSVCAMLESILRAAGLRTGLFTSPHLVSFNERIRVDGQCLTDDELAALIRRVEEAAELACSEAGIREATFFEMATAMGFEHFRRREVNVAVIETGMGGRLDATNVVNPLVSVITGISMEHSDWLGRDIRSIAREKSGIIKPGTPVIVGCLPAAALDVVSGVARERGARLVEAGKTMSVQMVDHSLSGTKIRIESSSASYGTLSIPLAGAKTPENAAVATAAIEMFADAAGLNIHPGSLKSGLERVRWPGRFHVVSRDPPLVVDGAHNPDAAQTLARSLRELLPGAAIGLVVGMSCDKDAAGFLRRFSGLVKKCWVTSIRSDRSLEPSVLADIATALGWQVKEAGPREAIGQAKAWAGETGGAACVTGSLFLAGEALDLLCGPGLF